MHKNSTKPTTYIALIGFILGIIAIVIATISIIGYRLVWWRQLEAFDIFGWATYVAIVALLFSIYGAYKTRSKGKYRGLWLCTLAIVLSLPIVISAFLFKYSATIYPPINDISTDTLNPPIFWDVPNPTEYPGLKVALIQKEGYPSLHPLKLSIPPKKAFSKALKIVKEKGWKIISADEEDGRIEAVSSSLLFGFKDEIVIRIVQEDKGVTVDLRSRSRIGRIDRGANARRIKSFISAFTD